MGYGINTDLREILMDTSKVYLREAEKKDCHLLWKWRNEKTVRKASFTTQFIPFGEHKKWFLEKLADKNTRILIILDNTKKQIGQIRFDIKEDKKTEIHINIDKNERKKAYGTEALKLACVYAFENLDVKNIVAYIKEENKASLRAFTKAGFVDLGVRDFKGSRAIEMCMDYEPR